MLPTGQVEAPAVGRLASGERWSVARKREVVLRLMRGEPAALPVRELGMPRYRFERWRERAQAAIDSALKEGETDAESAGRCRGDAADRRARDGDRTAARADRAIRPFDPQEVAVTAAAISPATGRAYGVTRVCRVFAMPRWSFYGGRGQSAGPAVETPVRRRRGPQPAVSDVALLSAIRADLARSAWHGEGHHKVWARLGVLDGIRLARKRVLRLMGETALLSPHRTRPSRSDSHGGRITTEAPTLMWATDAIQIFTVQDGKVWLFGVGEQWNADAVGWNITKRGDRYAAARNFVARYSAAWLIKKNSSQSPGNARAAWNQALMKQRA